MGNVIYDPFTNPYLRDDGRNGTTAQQFFYSGGNAAVFAQIMLIFFVSSWLVVPVNWSMHYCFAQCGRVRSDMVFGVFWNLLYGGIFTTALGGWELRDAFVYIKVYSLVAISMQLWFFKFWAGWPQESQTIMWMQSALLHGFVIINILEATIWEVVVIGTTGDHVINSLAGALLCVGVGLHTFIYGVSIVEWKNGKVRQGRCNFTPTWIIAYTFWNTAYNASYHPHKAAFYIFTTLLVPFGGAFWAGHDYLETRVHLLLHAANLRVLPFGGDAVLAATVGLFEEMFLSDGFRYTISIIGLIMTVANLVEMHLIMNKGWKWWDYKCPKELMLFDIVEPYPPESVRPVVHRMLKLPKPRLPGHFRKSMAVADNAVVADVEAAERNSISKANNPVFDRESNGAKNEA